MSNLDLWNKVQKTDPKHVKAITGKSYQGTSPKPHYLIHKATETFGPVGIGWGFHIVSERIEEGAGGEKMHFAHVRVWYEWPNRSGEYVKGEVEHVGGTQFSGVRSSGKPFTDEDAPKKSVTDALVKALSMIGFAGDIFMGRYDDSKYVSELKQEDEDASKTTSKANSDNLYARLSKANADCKTKADFNRLWSNTKTIDAQAQLGVESNAKLETAKANKFAELELSEPSDYQVPDFDGMDK